MKFLILCHYNVDRFAKLGPKDFEEFAQICEPHDKALKESGHLLMVGSLAQPEEARSIKAISRDEIRIEEGAFIKSDEPFGAFFIIEAATVDEAVEIAKMHPSAHLGGKIRGGMEVRPIEQMETL